MTSPAPLPGQQHGSRLDPYVDRYAERAQGMTASEIRALFSVASRPEVVSFAGGAPYVSALPLDVVADIAARLVSQRGSTALQYGSGQGDPVLRQQICEVMTHVGIESHPDDVVVTVGSQQALDLVTRIFVNPGDVVLAEAPSYVGALSTFSSYQAEVVHVAMDDDGLVPEALAEALTWASQQGKRVKFLYTVPNYHNPAGVSLSSPRRQQVLSICRQADVLIIEDDPYGLLGFDGSVPRALRADDAERVVYLGSFSKTFAPGLRVGWALAPHGVKDKLVLAAEASVLCPPTFSQAAISTYLSTEPWLDQVKAFRELYRERRDAMLESLQGQLPAEAVTWTTPAGGFYVWLTLPEGMDTKAMLPRAVTERVAYVPGTAFFADDSGARCLRLSYCHPEPSRIREGVRRLASVLEEEMDLAATFGPISFPAADGVQSPSPDTR